MTEQLLLLFQALFLVLLYVFIWRVMRSATGDLKIPDRAIPAAEAVRTASPVVPGPTEAALVVLASDSLEPGSIVRIAGAISIGRGPENAVVLPDDEFVSTRHARIEIEHDAARVVDLDSRNGTFVNGERVINTLQLEPEDVVRIGVTELKLTR